MNRVERWWLATCCWLGAAVRFRGLFANSFHADEALFAGWARLIAVWRDPLLLTQAVDKPPLLFYLQALFYPFFGPVEWAARMPSFIVSLLLIPLTAQVTRRLTGDGVAASVAAVCVALAPLAIQFSATAFSDPPLTFWLMAALYAAARPITTSRHPRATAMLPGLLFGLALATKYQALLFLPLLMGMGWIFGRRREWLGSLMGLGVVLVLLLLWQGARPASAGLIGLQWSNVGGIRPARSWELWPRLLETARLWRLSLGWPLAAVGAGAVGAGALIWSRGGRFRPSAAELLLLLFVSSYALLHWLWATPIWDRYLLPIFPLAAVLIGRGFALMLATLRERHFHRYAFRYAFFVALTLLTLALVPTALTARGGRFPIGGRADADGGAGRAARLLKDAPYGTVLYDHWYSWHWYYQLFDSRVYVSWFPYADALLDDLAVFAGRGPERYIALPSSAAAAPVRRRLSAAGYGLEALDGQDEAATMTLYRIIAPEISP